MQAADVIAMAGPVYFYSISAQLKAVIDRSPARWTDIPSKECYHIMTAAEDSDTVMECALECMRGFAACLTGSKETGVIEAKGVYEADAVRSGLYIQEAHAMGRNV